MSKITDIVIFGGTGDLSERKLIPALYRAYQGESLDKECRIVITARNPDDIQNYSQRIEKELNDSVGKDEVVDSESVSGFSENLYPMLLDIANDDDNWQNLADLLAEYPERERVYYLAIPPSVFSVCCENLHKHDLCANGRVVVEKPLGYDEASAESINEKIAQFFPEECIFRITAVPLTENKEA